MATEQQIVMTPADVKRSVEKIERECGLFRIHTISNSFYNDGVSSIRLYIQKHRENRLMAIVIFGQFTGFEVLAAPTNRTLEETIQWGNQGW